jgi:hypothetical protein
LVFQLRQAELVGDLFQQRQLALIAAELVFLVTQRVGVTGRPWILQVGAEGGVGQARATVELVIFKLRQHPETLGVAFEIEEVTSFRFAHCVQPAAPGGLLEPVPNRIFTGMPERRVADVMGQAGRLHHHAQVAGFAPVGQGAAHGFADTHAQRAADAADFQGMGQAGVDMVVARNRMHLGLAPEAAKGAGENDAVMVFVKGLRPSSSGLCSGFPRRSRLSRVCQSKAGSLRQVTDC